jgi:hypothetical protein
MAKKSGSDIKFPYNLAKTSKVNMIFVLMSLHVALTVGIGESHIFRLIKQKNS